MKFSIGDLILLKRTGEEGVVIAMISKTMMEVVVNGTQFPVYIEDVDHPYLKWFTERKKTVKRLVAEIPMERAKDRPVRLPQGIYLSFMPVYIQDTMEDIVADVRIYLLNETASPLYFMYDAKDANGSTIFRHQGGLHAFGNIYLHSLTLEAMNAQPRLNWLLGDDVKVILSSDNKGTVRIKPQKLFEQLEAVQQSGAPSFTYYLSEDSLGKLKKPLVLPPILQAVPASIAPASVLWQPKEVLDLHIEALVTETKDLSHGEILQMQLDTLHYHLDMAIAHEQRSLVIIHGLGIGTLRGIVHQVLNEKDGVDSFKNEWNGRHGYGATVVFFK